MPDDDDIFRLGKFTKPLTLQLMRYLSRTLELRFRISPGDQVVAHRIIENADDVSIMLLCSHLDDNSGFGIFIHGAGTDPHSELVTEYQSKVDEALEPLKSA